MHDIKNILKQYWGFETFRPMQEEIITSVLNKHDTLALLPTGGGKSLCFQVPALAQEGMCLVISPLIALMRDQVLNLTKKGIKAGAIYTGLPYGMADSILDGCVYGRYKFLYVSPERLATEQFRARLAKMNVSLLAVDEAHCVSQWGYDFRPPYLKIAEVRQLLSDTPVIALTATATPNVIEDIQKKLEFRNQNVFRQSFVRKNLSYVVRRTSNKNQSIFEILGKVKGSAIVYVRSRRRAKEYSDFLNKNKISSGFYHAGLSPVEKLAIQDNWHHNKTRVLCCTNAFGMGIDKPDVRIVLHPDLTDNIESYFQEAGRAGRDGQKAHAVLLTDGSSTGEIDEKISEAFPSIDFVKTIYESLCRFLRIAYHSGLEQGFDFDLRQFSRQHDLNPMKVQTALSLLQQQELIYVTDSVYTQSQVKMLARGDALNRFQKEHRKLEPLLKFILRTSEGVFEDYIAFEEGVAASRLKISEEELIEQLEMLSRSHVLEYQPRKDKPQLIFLQNRVPEKDLVLDRAFIIRRKTDFEDKLKSVRYYITENDKCRTRMLVKYFGEELAEDCGVCDVCISRKKAALAGNGFSQVAAAIERELKGAPLSLSEIKSRLSLDANELNHALGFLLDHGKIERTKEATLKWVE